MISNVPTRIDAMFDPEDRLVKVAVNLVTADVDARSKYESTLELRAKYGQPDVEVRDCDSSYEAGDGYEETAARLTRFI